MNKNSVSLYTSGMRCIYRTQFDLGVGSKKSSLALSLGPSSLPRKASLFPVYSPALLGAGSISMPTPQVVFSEPIFFLLCIRHFGTYILSALSLLLCILASPNALDLNFEVLEHFACSSLYVVLLRALSWLLTSWIPTLDSLAVHSSALCTRASDVRSSVHFLSFCDRFVLSLG
jgi:hypothetical protein